MGIGGGPADRLLPDDIIPNHITPIVFRTSGPTDQGRAPCAGAYRSTMERIERVKVEWANSWAPGVLDRWLAEGLRYGGVEINGEWWLFRGRGLLPCWRIKIATLADLLALEAACGEIVLCRHDDNPDELVLEIYDSYRE